MSNLNLNVYKKMNERRAKRRAFPVSLQKMNMIDNTMSRVVLKVETAFHSIMSEETAAASIATLGVRYMPNSLHRVSEKDNTLFGAFVAKNNETMSMTDAKEMASAGNMVQVSDTVFQDSNDHIWSVQADGDTAYLIKQQEEDIGSLLRAQHARAIATASSSVQLFEDYSAGMPFAFYDQAREELAFAIGVNGATAFVPDRGTIMEVASEMVVATWDGKQLNTAEQASSGSKQDLIDYFTMLYGHNKAFLAEIKDIIYTGVSV